ncbi:hypothetical protein BY458DRAFT_514791 [Sporodiniella umbellata]|nr:hypothetical protein BY458DRAFT_514791 [Sporodiniella umbellata]
MKFGAYLQDNLFSPWRLSYFSYNRLKQELKRRTLNSTWTPKDQEEFSQLIENELAQVQDFINAKLRDLESRLIYCERTREDTSIDETLTDLLFDLNALEKFIRLNHTALQKILKKHARWTKEPLRTRFLEDSRALDVQRLDNLWAHISALQHKTVPAEVYWVQAEDVVGVKSDLLLQAAVDSEVDISCVYLDTACLKNYTTILQREKDADYVRIRWQSDSQNVLVESKKRTLFTLTEDEATRFISGQTQLPNLHLLRPVLRITYHRITFALSEGQKTHLDTNIIFHQAEQTYHFPQALLGPHNLDLISARPVRNFSKYVHGINHFYEMPLVPSWVGLKPPEPTVVAVIEEAEPLLTSEQPKLLAQKIPDQDLEAGRPEVKVKLDSKTFFSNERTFISWLQFSALLLSASVNLLNFGDSTSRIAGGVFVGIAGAVALYSLYRFEKRAWMIGHRSIGRYEDLWGPAALCVILVCALMINIYLRFR